MKEKPNWAEPLIISAVITGLLIALYYFNDSALLRPAKRASEKSTTATLVSSVKADFRNIKNALTLYRLDHKAYPLTASAGVPLTTPIQYLPELLPDRFAAPGSKELYSYFSNGTQWLLSSRGPDEDTDIDVANLRPPDPGYISGITYDPSNGLVSNGDILRIGTEEKRQNDQAGE